MKKVGILTLSVLSLSLLFAGSAFTDQDTLRHQDNFKDIHMSKAPDTLFNGAVSGDQLIGMSVENQAGKTIGTVSGKETNANGEIKFIAVSTGGSMGRGGEERLVPTSAFVPTKKANALVLTVNDNLLATAPIRTPEMTESSFHKELYEHYGQAPAWGLEEKYNSESSSPGPDRP